jgi:hypothetical protein
MIAVEATKATGFAMTGDPDAVAAFWAPNYGRYYVTIGHILIYVTELRETQPPGDQWLPCDKHHSLLRSAIQTSELPVAEEGRLSDILKPDVDAYVRAPGSVFTLYYWSGKRMPEEVKITTTVLFDKGWRRLLMPEVSVERVQDACPGDGCITDPGS